MKLLYFKIKAKLFPCKNCNGKGVILICETFLVTSMPSYLQRCSHCKGRNVSSKRFKEIEDYQMKNIYG